MCKEEVLQRFIALAFVTTYNKPQAYYISPKPQVGEQTKNNPTHYTIENEKKTGHK